ncbi:MAG: MFS transporter [Prosthecobacter sp.]|nr:MFS transporter [Prosthecobacter sp.]
MSAPPTRVRYTVLTVTTLAAFLMYLDRICMSEIVKTATFRAEFPLTDNQLSWVLGAFFWAYALGQVPAGWLSDRFGIRPLMTIFIVLWSIFTALTGFATGLWTLLLTRVGCGLAEAGAYPASSSLLRKWAAWGNRGVASSIVSLGGRLGGAVAPLLTMLVISYFGNWRWAGWMYGVAGVAFAWAFWRIYRESPEVHPACNDAERALLTDGRPLVGNVPPYRFPWGDVLRSGNLWRMCAAQFWTNVGWAFLATWMPRYLKETLHLGDEASGTLSTVSLLIGLGGMMSGGVFADVCARRFGPRRGRMLPLVVTRFAAAVMFVLAIQTTNPWLLVPALGMVAFFTDAGLPAVWATMQDIGGRYTAPIFGWANMWGNIGAALSPVFIALINKYFDKNGDWHEALYFCAIAFVISGVHGMGIDARQRIDIHEETVS